jgi:hypothetical protein
MQQTLEVSVHQSQEPAVVTATISNCGGQHDLLDRLGDISAVGLATAR